MFVGHFGLGFAAKRVAPEVSLGTLILAAGVVLYARGTTALDRTGRWAWWSLVAFLVAVYFANLFGPPPPAISAVAWVSESMWLLVIWGWWTDRHRVPRRLALP